MPNGVLGILRPGLPPPTSLTLVMPRDSATADTLDRAEAMLSVTGCFWR